MAGTRTRTRAADRAPRRTRRQKRVHRRRRLVAIGAAVLVGVLAALVFLPDPFEDAVREITLPLRHDDIIRQQAKDKDLDAALIAAVIYEESRFRDQTSPAGAKGLMQITPDTAQFIAKRTGGTQFELRDLGTPQINISYGSWYLRYLLDRYEGEDEPAIAAYNAGAGNVDRWIAAAGGIDDFEPKEHISFPETRNYVLNVMERREEYEREYPRELGL